MWPSPITYSAAQEDLVKKNGNPDYLAILFNSDAERREETWTYTALGKMYLFWDGVQVGEQNITIDPTLYMNPPSVDPSLFAGKTKPSDVIKTFGNDYTVTDASDVNPNYAAFDFKTYYFKDKGVLASFVGEQLVVVQATDIPVDAAGRMTLAVPGDVTGENSDSIVSQAQEETKLDPCQMVVVATIIGVMAQEGAPVMPYSAIIACKGCIADASYCPLAIKALKDSIGDDKTVSYATTGFIEILDAADLISIAEEDCKGEMERVFKPLNPVNCSGKTMPLSLPVRFRTNAPLMSIPNGLHVSQTAPVRES